MDGYCYAPKKKRARKSISNASRPILPKKQIVAANSPSEFFGKRYRSYEQMRLYTISSSIAKMVDEGFAKKKPKSAGIAKSESNPAQTYAEYLELRKGKPESAAVNPTSDAIEAKIKKMVAGKNGNLPDKQLHGAINGNGSARNGSAAKSATAASAAKPETAASGNTSPANGGKSAAVPHLSKNGKKLVPRRQFEITS